jgi:prepilin-type processing-associated H-X9-DG protein
MTAQHDHCEQIRERLLLYLAETLREAEAKEIAAHLETCAECRDAYEALHAEYEALGMLPDTPPPRGLAARTVAEVVSLDETRKRPKPRFNWLPWLATAAVVMVVAAILLPALARPREAARRASAQNNLKQIGLSFKMYSNEDRGERFPPMAPVDGVWVPDLRVLYPEYLPDYTVLIMPSSATSSEDMEQLGDALQANPPDWDTAHRIVARHVVYTGYALQTPEEVRLFGEVQSQRPQRVRDKDISTGKDTLYRLREGIERFFITNINNAAQSSEAQSEMFVLCENAFNGSAGHVPAGANILYLDGHVDFQRETADHPYFAALRELLGAPPYSPRK